MSALTNQQAEFAVLIARLVLYGADNGYHLRYGDAWRNTTYYPCPHCSELVSYQDLLIADGKSWKLDSLHADRLAVDFVVERTDGAQMMNSDWRTLGEHWEGLGGTDWGGRYGVPVDARKSQVGKDPGHFGMKKVT